MLYIRMFLVMAVTLYTSRIILHGLGIENFGIYSVIGGVIGLFGFVNSSMSLSVQRYLSYELGKEDMGRVSLTFGMSLVIHILIALVLGLLLYVSADYITESLLNIPVDKKEASAVFFRFIIISTCLNILQVPFMGLIIAFEKMGLLAWVSVAEVLFKLLVAFAITWIPGNPLIVYGLLLGGVSFLTLAIYFVVCRWRIDCISYSLKWDGSLFRNLLSFASWSALGEIAWAFTIQGVSFLLNHFYGVICNAGYGIATQISGAVNKFVSSFQTALNPQIIKMYAATYVDNMLRLTFRGIKLSFFLVLLIGIPLLAGMGTILHLWLGVVPDYAVVFSRLVIISILLDSLSNLLATVAKAYGRIRRYQLFVSCVLFMNFPVSWLVLKLGLTPYSVVVVYCCVSLSLLLLRLTLVSNMLQRNIRGAYFSAVFIPVLVVSVICALIFTGVILLLDDTVVRLVTVTLLNIVLLPALVYWLALDGSEKAFVKSKISSIFSRLRWKMKSV